LESVLVNFGKSPATGDSRAAPEYVNIRQEVVQEGTKLGLKT